MLILYCIFTAIAVFLLFYHLKDIEIIKTDEASHGTDAYEMLAHGNALVNTYRYLTDFYAAKPPLGFWAIMIGYRLFGYNTFGLWFSSAFAACLILFICGCFLWKRYGDTAAVVFSAVFPLMTSLYRFHCFRAGDMDALYCLFFTLAMISLYETADHPRAIIFYGLFGGLGFLTKSTHSAIIFLIGLLYLPVIFRKIRPRVLFASIAAAAVPTAIWAAARYRFDGMKFLRTCIIEQSQGRATFRPSAVQLINVLTTPVWMVLNSMLILLAVLAALRSKAERKQGKLEFQ